MFNVRKAVAAFAAVAASIAMAATGAIPASATVAPAQAVTASSTTPSSAVAEASAAAAGLQQNYNSSTGEFNTTGWWNSANALNALVEYMERTGSRAYLGDLSTTFADNPSFIDSYYDDNGWWGLTWVNAYDLTGQVRYLNMAKSIFQVNTGAWDSTCGGGIWWSTAKTYKNAIANELFLKLAIELHERTPGDTYYLGWALKEWNWFAQSGMINSDHLVNDGLTEISPTDCVNNGATTWTYNQGVILGGLVGLYQATNNKTYLTTASQIATAVITSSTLVENGILTEPCNPITNCGGDGSQFKGVFMRNLYELYQVTKNPAYRTFLDNNAASIWANDRSGDQLGLLYQGPYSSSTANASTQSSALDALNAALPTGSAPVAVTSLAGDGTEVVAPNGQEEVIVAPGGQTTATLAVTPIEDRGAGASIRARVETASGSPAAGVTVTPSTISLGAGPGKQARATLTISARSRATPNFYELVVRTAADGVALPSQELTVLVAPPNGLLRQYNSIGVSSDTNQVAADLDGLGSSYSAQALAAATPDALTPGSTVTVDGARLTWPVAPAGFPDNISAFGQTLPITASAGATELVVLGTAVNSPDQALTLNYTDGSSATLWLNLPDWTLDAGSETVPSGVTVAASTPYRNSMTTTSQNITTDVFAGMLPLEPGKTLASVTLPYSGGNAALHVFAVGTSSAAVSGPVVTGVSPSTASPGSEVTITGSGFGSSQGSGSVSFTDGGATWGGSGGPLTIDSWSNTAVAVTVPSSDSTGLVTPGSVAQLTVTNASAQTSDSAVLQITPSSNVADYADNVGISPATDTTCADIDGDGSSYSATYLADAGLTPGASVPVSSEGLTYTWPDAATCTPDNIMADGQTIAVNGQAGDTTLGFIGTSVNGSSTGPVIIHYSDGTSTAETVSFGDWFSGPAPTDVIVATMPDRNVASGPQSLTINVYATSVSLDPSKTVTSVTLPSIGDAVASGVPAMHIFGLAVGS